VWLIGKGWGDRERPVKGVIDWEGEEASEGCGRLCGKLLILWGRYMCLDGASVC